MGSKTNWAVDWAVRGAVYLDVDWGLYESLNDAIEWEVTEVMDGTGDVGTAVGDVVTLVVDDDHNCTGLQDFLREVGGWKFDV
jgi:hypothetical protein